MMRLHCKVISFATAAVLRLITRGLSPAENSTANRVAAPPAKSSAEATPGAPDNSGRNVRDRAANGLTLFSQSSAASDVDLTRRIRRALVQDKYLSTLA